MNQKLSSVNLKFSKIIMGLFILLLIWVGILYIYVWPKQIMLNLHVPQGVITSYESSSIRTWFSGNRSAYRTAVWERKYIAGLPGSSEDFNSPEEIFAYLDTWLSENGWRRYEEKGDPCAILAESEFLKRGEQGYISYIPKDSPNPYNQPAVCVAVWPFSDGGNSVYNVLVLTSSR